MQNILIQILFFHKEVGFLRNNHFFISENVTTIKHFSELNINQIIIFSSILDKSIFLLLTKGDVYFLVLDLRKKGRPDAPSPNNLLIAL